MDMRDMLNDFKRFSYKQLTCGDFDTEHPVCQWLIKSRKIPYESGLWLSFLYMAFYDEASAWVVFKETEPFVIPRRVDLPIGMNRRNLFGGKILDHFASLKKVRESASNWPTHNFSGDPKKDWDTLKENLGTVWGNGRFANYTTAELLQKVNGVRVEITGFDNKDSSGPADGLSRIFGCDKKDVAKLDQYGEESYQILMMTRACPSYTKLDRGVTESILCNFSAVCRGKYYSGRNIDRQQERIKRVEKLLGIELTPLWRARVAVFREKDLGEFSNWDGIDKERLQLYKKTGEILWTYERR